MARARARIIYPLQHTLSSFSVLLDIFLVDWVRERWPAKNSFDGSNKCRYAQRTTNIVTNSDLYETHYLNCYCRPFRRTFPTKWTQKTKKNRSKEDKVHLLEIDQHIFAPKERTFNPNRTQTMIWKYCCTNGCDEGFFHIGAISREGIGNLAIVHSVRPCHTNFIDVVDNLCNGKYAVVEGQRMCHLAVGQKKTIFIFHLTNFLADALIEFVRSSFME